MSAKVAATMVVAMITPFKPCMVFSPLVKPAVANFACTGATFSDQYRTTVRGPFCRSLMPKCHSESHPPARRRYLPGRGRSSWLTGCGHPIKKGLEQSCFWDTDAVGTCLVFGQERRCSGPQ